MDSSPDFSWRGKVGLVQIDEMMLERARIGEALTQVGEGIIVVGHTGKIRFINEVAAAILGRGVAETTGLAFAAVFQLIDADRGQALPCPVSEALRVGRPVVVGQNAVLVAQDGSHKLVAATCSPLNVPWFPQTGVVVVLRDITRLRLLEQEQATAGANFSAMFDSNPVTTMLLDEQGRIVLVNAAALRLTGSERANLVGQRLGDGLHCLRSLETAESCGHGQACAACRFSTAILQALAGTVTDNLELSTTLLRQGRPVDFWFRCSAAPIKLAGRPHVLVTMVDVTDTKRRELTAVASNDACLQMLDNLPAMVWRVNAQGDCDYFSQVWLNYTGMTLDESVGSGWLRALHPEDVERCKAVIWRAFQARQPFEIEHRTRRQDGSYAWTTGVGRPHCQADGSFAGFIGAVFDVSEWRFAEERYRMLASKVSDIILFMDTAGRIQEANSSAMTAYGYTRDELLALTILDLSQDGEAVRRRMTDADSEQTFWEAVHRRKDGTTFPVEMSLQQAQSRDQSGLVSVIRDITGRKRAEEEMRRSKEAAEAASKAKGEFLANMSHEIRTPINGMIGMIDLTLLTGLDAEQRENLQTAKSCADSLLNIINDILDFSKIEAGKLLIERVAFSPRELLAEIARTHALRAAQKGLELCYGLSSSIPDYLIGDPHRLRQVLNNLVNNAIKFTEQGEVRIDVRRAAGDGDDWQFVFAVSDTGVGIAPADQLRLFQSFSQVDGSYTRKYGGTGLGLVISRQLVEMMGGEIWLESQVGRGSRFQFRLPLAIGVEPTRPAPRVAEPPAVLRKLSILLVEDDKVNQMVIARLLQERGHRVDVVDNGLEAVTAHQQRGYDVILMDIQMPVLDGIEATQRIRRSEGDSRHTPIIALTAFALQGDRERFLELGLDEYIAKPVDTARLLALLDQVAGGRGAESAAGHRHSLEPARVQPDQPDVADLASLTDDLVVALGNSQPAQAEQLAHRLKALLSTLEADELKDLAFKLELAIRRGDSEQALQRLAALRQGLRTYQRIQPDRVGAFR